MRWRLKRIIACRRHTGHTGPNHSSNLYLAIENDLEIIPVINKIDMDGAMIPEVKDQIIELVGWREDEILLASGKSGIGIEEILQAIVERIPAPKGNPDAPLGGIDISTACLTVSEASLFTTVFLTAVSKKAIK